MVFHKLIFKDLTTTQLHHVFASIFSIPIPLAALIKERKTKMNANVLAPGGGGGGL